MIKPNLIKAIVDKWDTKNRVFGFGKVEIRPTIEEFERLIGVPYNCEKNYHLVP